MNVEDGFSFTSLLQFSPLIISFSSLSKPAVCSFLVFSLQGQRIMGSHSGPRESSKRRPNTPGFRDTPFVAWKQRCPETLGYLDTSGQVFFKSNFTLYLNSAINSDFNSYVTSYVNYYFSLTLILTLMRTEILTLTLTLHT